MLPSTLADSMAADSALLLLRLGLSLLVFLSVALTDNLVLLLAVALLSSFGFAFAVCEPSVPLTDDDDDEEEDEEEEVEVCAEVLIGGFLIKLLLLLFDAEEAVDFLLPKLY